MVCSLLLVFALGASFVTADDTCQQFAKFIDQPCMIPNMLILSPNNVYKSCDVLVSKADSSHKPNVTFSDAKVCIGFDRCLISCLLTFVNFKAGHVHIISEGKPDRSVKPTLSGQLETIEIYNWTKNLIGTTEIRTHSRSHCNRSSGFRVSTRDLTTTGAVMLRGVWILYIF